MTKPINVATVNEINFILIAAGNSWEDLIAHCTNVQAAISQPTPTPTPKSDVDAKFVVQAIEGIMNSYGNGSCKLSRSAKEFLLSLRERAGLYSSVRFSPKQWSWFNSIMADAGVESLELPS
jgi:hypothetical protein